MWPIYVYIRGMHKTHLFTFNGGRTVFQCMLSSNVRRMNRHCTMMFKLSFAFTHTYEISNEWISVYMHFCSHKNIGEYIHSPYLTCLLYEHCMNILSNIFPKMFPVIFHRHKQVYSTVHIIMHIRTFAHTLVAHRTEIMIVLFHV